MEKVECGSRKKEIVRPWLSTKIKGLLEPSTRDAFLSPRQFGAEKTAHRFSRDTLGAKHTKKLNQLSSFFF